MRYAVRYVHKVSPSDKDTHEPIDLDERALGDKRKLAAALRECGVLMSGARVTEFRVERDGQRVIVFPSVPGLTTYWHSVILTSEPSALAALKAEAASVGWPLQFPTDLTMHDAAAITNEMLPRQPFTWCLRDSGTHLGRFIAPSDKPNATPSITLKMADVVNTFGANYCRVYVWDGRKLERVSTGQEADERLAFLGVHRFEVRPRRSSSFTSFHFLTRREADLYAIECEKRYGEDFVTVDTWER